MILHDIEIILTYSRLITGSYATLSRLYAESYQYRNIYNSGDTESTYNGNTITVDNNCTVSRPTSTTLSPPPISGHRVTNDVVINPITVQ